MRFPTPFRRPEKKKKPPPQPIAGRLINLGAIALFAVLVLNQMKHHDETRETGAPENPAPDTLTVHYIEAARGKAVDFFSKLGPQSAASWTDILPGTGPAALCGQAVQAHLALLEGDSEETIKGLPVPANRQWRLGKPEMPIDHLAEPLMLGLRPGGMREARLPLSVVQSLYNPPHVFAPTPRPGQTMRDRLVRLRVTLTHGEPPPDSPFPLTILETVSGDSGHRAACGDKIALGIRLWNAQGLPLESLDKAFPRIDSKSDFAETPAHRITARLGEGTLPAGLERAAEGMGLGATRILLVPPPWQKETGDTMGGIGWAFDQPPATAIVEIMLTELGDNVVDAPDPGPAPSLWPPESLHPPCCGPDAKPPTKTGLHPSAALLKPSSQPPTEAPAP